MLSFEEIEACFPDGSYGDDAICVSAQWLHDFANAVAAKEREACAKVCEARHMGDNNREKWAKNENSTTYPN